MTYEANFNTAITYLRAGLKDRSLESLHRAYTDIPEGDKVATNITYFRVLTLLARLFLEQGKKNDAIRFIEEGLRTKDNHSDLLFLKSLYYWDSHCFEDMFEMLIRYLVSRIEANDSQYDYEFVNEGAMREVLSNLIPVSFSHSVSKDEMLAIVGKLAGATQDKNINLAYELLSEMKDRKAGQTNV